jgi:hypothetical protein
VGILTPKTVDNSPKKDPKKDPKKVVVGKITPVDI